jgi:hypothetical protein
MSETYKRIIPMSKKVLNTQSVINELRGQSAFFKQDVTGESKTYEAVQKAIVKPTKDPKKQSETPIEKEAPKPVNSKVSSSHD